MSAVDPNQIVNLPVDLRGKIPQIIRIQVL